MFLCEEQQPKTLDVQRRVVIAIQFETTLRAGVPAFVQIFGHDSPTSAAPLAGVLGVHKQHTRTGPFCLAHTELLELSPPSI